MASGSQGSLSVDAKAFRQTMGRFATGVTVITTTVGQGLHGMTANAFTSVSLDPPLVLVCVGEGAKMHGYLEESDSFAVSILAEGQQGLAEWFAQSGRAPSGEAEFEGIDWEPGPVLGHPLLRGSLAHLECEVHAVHPGGDHSIILGSVVSTEARPDGSPLAYFRGRYHRLERDDPRG